MWTFHWSVRLNLLLIKLFVFLVFVCLLHVLFKLTVLTDAPLATQLLVNDWTRKHNRRFITTDARGLFGFIFVDVGVEFRINDLNGERCKEVSLTVHFALFGKFSKFFLFHSTVIISVLVVD